MPSREIKVAIIGDPSSLQRALSTADRGVSTFATRMQNVGSRMRSVGATMTRSLTLPLVGFGVIAFRELSQGERALAQTEAVIESTGGAARRSVQDIVELSQSLSELTSLDDEPIQEAANTLLTFQNIAGETFDEATRATLDLSVAMDRDLRSSAVLVGRALNNPIKGLTALTRVGVDFDSQYRDTQFTMRQAIEWFVALGDTARAQQIIMEELNAEFGGSAEALGGTFTGRLNRVKNRFEALGAEILENLVPVFEDLADIIDGLGDRFDDLTPSQQKFVAFAVLGAALAGPLTSVLGLLASAVGTLTGAFTALGAAVGVSGGLIGALILSLVALGVAIYVLVTNWDQATLVMQNFVSNAVANIPGVGFAIDQVKFAVDRLREALSFIAGAAQGAWNALSALGRVVLDGLISALNAVLSLVGSIASSVAALGDALAAVGRTVTSLPGRVADIAIPSGARPGPRSADFLPKRGRGRRTATVSPRGMSARDFAKELTMQGGLPVIVVNGVH